MLTEDQVALCHQTFALRSFDPNAVVMEFYIRLFETAPELRQLFPADLKRQANKLVAAMQLAVSSLHDMPSLVAPLHDLGAAHAGYGVTPDQYPLVADTLLETLASETGPHWTPAHEHAWRAVLGTIADHMLEGARRAAVPQARSAAG